MSFAGREFLRDLGGGGPGAVPEAIAKVERANREQSGMVMLDESTRSALSLAGSAEERPFRSTMFELALRSEHDPDRGGVSVQLAENGFGRFKFDLITLVALSGDLERMAMLTRLGPPLLLRLRGAIAVQASGREMQLLCALDTHYSLREAAVAMNITRPTARTLGERLGTRVGAAGIAETLDRLLELGRRHRYR